MHAILLRLSFARTTSSLANFVDPRSLPLRDINDLAEALMLAPAFEHVPSCYEAFLLILSNNIAAGPLFSTADSSHVPITW